MSRIASLCFLACLALALLLLAGTARAQDDADVTLHQLGRAIDFDYGVDGTLVAAFVKPGTPADKICVQSSPDKGQRWTTLYDGPLGNVQTLVQLSVAVAAGYPGTGGDQMVFIGVHGIWTTGGKGYGFMGLLSGSSITPWSKAYCQQILPGSGNQMERAPWNGMHLSCAVIPLVDANPKDYAVGVAFKYPMPAWRSSSIQVGYSTDHGATLRDTRIIAGPGGESVAAAAEFGYPSLIGDPVNRETVLAFHDESAKVVTVAAAQSRFHIFGKGALASAFTTPANDRRSEHHPEIATYDGDLHFTCLTGEPDRMSSYQLTWYRGNTQSGGFVEVRDPQNGNPLHFNAITPCDIIVRRSDAFMTALCVIDPAGATPGVGVVAFEGNRRDGSEMRKVVVNDQMVAFADPPCPKVAVVGVGGPFRAQSYGYSQFGMQAARVMMDP